MVQLVIVQADSVVSSHAMSCLNTMQTPRVIL